MKQQDKQVRNIQDYRLIALSMKKSGGKPWSVLTSDEVIQALGLTPLQTSKLFSRLASQERIQQLRRGLYIAPGTELPLGKRWTPSPYESLYAYMDWLDANWQITGLAAFNHHGFSTQISQVITVYNDKISETVESGGGRFIFIKRPYDKLGNKLLCPMYGNIEIPFSSKARTIFDAIYDAKRFGTLPSAYTWIKWVLEVEKNNEIIQELIQCCLKYGNKQTIARVGFVLEELNIDASLLAKQLELNKSSTLIPLVPFIKDIPGERKGTINQRWNIIENKTLSNIFSDMEIPDEDETE
jgi:predicted transcriptional regulator of viral defense system